MFAYCGPHWFGGLRGSSVAAMLTISVRRASGRVRSYPAVIHVDHSAQPQIIDRADNPLYYDIVSAFERETGLPALVNTSFNVHEEPIVNTPSECIRALRDGRIDFVVTDQGLYDCPRA